MNRARSASLAGALAVLVLTACGDGGVTEPDGDDGGGGGGTGPMRATIAGVPWVAPAANVQSFYIASTNTYGLVGADLTGNLGSRALLLNLAGVTGPGTYSLPSTTPYRYANTGNGTNVWETSGAGSSGSVTVTVATPTRIAGTFFFTAVPASGNTTGTTVSVTNGVFDVTIAPRR